MEMVDGTGTVYSTYHWQDSFPAAKCTYPHNHSHLATDFRLPPRWNATLHEWAVERGPEHVAFALDGVVLLTATKRSHDRVTKRAPKFWDVPWYLILNTAIVGTPGHWPLPANASTAFPSSHMIDYVRVARLV